MLIFFEQVWGGYRIYTSLVGDQIWAALHDFIANGPQDPKAAIICNSNFAIGGLKIYMVFYFYDGALPPIGAFRQFEAIVPLLDLTSSRTYADLVSSQHRYPISDH